MYKNFFNFTIQLSVYMSKNNKCNIILLTLDDVRADRFLLKKYRQSIIPNINKLLEDSIIFKNAFSPASWTRSSIASLFTGRYPSFHDMKIPAPKLQKTQRIYLNNKTIADYLKLKNYDTYGIIPTPTIRKALGYDKGFNNYIECWKPPLSYLRDPNFDYHYIMNYIRDLIYGNDKYAHYIIKKIERHIKKQIITKKKFFVYTDFINAHAPWSAPRKYRLKFELRKPKKKIKGKPILITHNVFSKIIKLVREGKWEFINIYPYIAEKFKTSNYYLELLKSKYNAEIAYLDAEIGKFIHFLKEKNIYDDTLIIITSDHGESFGEHGLLFHKFHLYDNLIRIPLIIKPPFKTKVKKINGLVSLVDILPTILSLTGIKSSEKLDGISLYPFNENNTHKYIFSELGWCYKYEINTLKKLNPNKDFSKIFFPKQCVRTKKYKLFTYIDGKKELFDIQNDSSENKNIINQETDIYNELMNNINSDLIPLNIQMERELLKIQISKIKMIYKRLL